MSARRKSKTGAKRHAAGCGCFACCERREGVTFGPPTCEADAAIRTLRPYTGGRLIRVITVQDGKVLSDENRPVGEP